MASNRRHRSLSAMLAARRPQFAERSGLGYLVAIRPGAAVGDRRLSGTLMTSGLATETRMMHKLLYEVAGEYREHSFPAVFNVSTAGTVPRVHAGLPAGGLEAFEVLTSQLEAPLVILYVLHTPRGEAPAGRYQSRDFSHFELKSLLGRFTAFLCSDSRFDLWVYSPSERATVVLDRHNQLFAYGPIDRFSSALRSIGYEQGAISVDFPHIHQFMPEFDRHSEELLSTLDWIRTDLRPEDEQ